MNECEKQLGFKRFKLFLGDLLENYCWDDDLMNFARVLFSVSILLTFPIECFVSREVSHGIFDLPNEYDSKQIRIPKNEIGFHFVFYAFSPP